MFCDNVSRCTHISTPKPHKIIVPLSQNYRQSLWCRMGTQCKSHVPIISPFWFFFSAFGSCEMIAYDPVSFSVFECFPFVSHFSYTILLDWEFRLINVEQKFFRFIPQKLIENIVFFITCDSKIFFVIFIFVFEK